MAGGILESPKAPENRPNQPYMPGGSLTCGPIGLIPRCSKCQSLACCLPASSPTYRPDPHPAYPEGRLEGPPGPESSLPRFMLLAVAGKMLVNRKQPHTHRIDSKVAGEHWTGNLAGRNKAKAGTGPC